MNLDQFQSNMRIFAFFHYTPGEYNSYNIKVNTLFWQPEESRAEKPSHSHSRIQTPVANSKDVIDNGFALENNNERLLSLGSPRVALLTL